MRCVLTSVCVLVLGFAPVPFPKKKARGERAISAAELVGTWRVVQVVRAPDRTPQPGQPGAAVTFGLTQWRFGAATYDVRFDPSKRPAEFDLMRPGQGVVYGRGVIRRDGERVVMAYTWNGPRPAGFEGLTQGFVRTLERVPGKP